MSDYDTIKNWIIESRYKPETPINNLVLNILDQYENERECDNWFSEEFDAENCKLFVEASGGLSMFDYFT